MHRHTGFPGHGRSSRRQSAGAADRVRHRFGFAETEPIPRCHRTDHHTR